jgi:hypothetical protein
MMPAVMPGSARPVMTTGNSSATLPPAARPPRHVSCRSATPDMGRAAAGERFRIEVLGPPPPRHGRRTNHNGPEFTRRSPATISPPTEATWPRPTPRTLPRATSPIRPRRHSGAKRFSPVNTIDLLPERSTGQLAGSLAAPGRPRPGRASSAGPHRHRPSSPGRRRSTSLSTGSAESRSSAASRMNIRSLPERPWAISESSRS